MCGIAGVASLAGPVARDDLVAMRDALTHRGPDDCGLWIAPAGAASGPPRPVGLLGPGLAIGLAHRRLSILDLSECGRQPMGNEDGSLQIVFNGEIYNYRDLRADLKSCGHRFTSRTDTEVIVHGYEEWGTGVVGRLHGMFAFAVWDANRQTLLLARDRFGIKPLFYAWRDGVLLFASELKSLLRHPGLARREIDDSALYDYLTHLYIPTPKTAWKGVHKFPAGHLLEWHWRQMPDGELPPPRRYWDIEFDTEVTSEDTSAAQFPEILTAALESHLMSDVPLGVFLSGGLDSGTAVALLRQRLQVPVQTFTASFDVAQHSEAAGARLVAQTFGTSHHETTVSLGSLDEALDNVVDLYDEPFGDGSAVPTSAICRFARQTVTVALAGDGGDETLAGYSWYSGFLKWQRLNRQLRVVPGRDWWRRRAPDRWKLHGLGRRVLLEPVEHYARANGNFTRPVKRRLLAPDLAAHFDAYDDYWYYRKHWRDDLPVVSALQYVDMHTYLPDDILTKVDRASMKWGLEVRVPFLDAGVAAAFAAWPIACRHDGQRGKVALRRAMQGILPEEVLQGRKRGFSSPWGAWLDPDLVAQRLAHGALMQRGWLSPRAVQWTQNREISGGRAWSLLVLDHWLSLNA